jgi:carbonic anhydrase/acetyltransferase-like protein (isoleucine patch superfamily)
LVACLVLGILFTICKSRSVFETRIFRLTMVDKSSRLSSSERGKPSMSETETRVMHFPGSGVPVKVHRHSNGGGWVADTAKVESSVYVGRNATVRGRAKIYGKAIVRGDATVKDSATVKENAVVQDSALVMDNAIVCGGASLWGKSVVYGNAKICGTAVLDKYAVFGGNSTINSGVHRYHYEENATNVSLRNNGDDEIKPNVNKVDIDVIIHKKPETKKESVMPIFLMYNFQDGNGPVPAHRHPNGGGWVANTSTVDDSAYVGPHAAVFGRARVLENAYLNGMCRVYDDAVIIGNVTVSDFAQVYGTSTLCGHAKVSGHSVIRCSKICESAHISGFVTVANSLVGGFAFIYGERFIDNEIVTSNEKKN